MSHAEPPPDPTAVRRRRPLRTTLLPYALIGPAVVVLVMHVDMHRVTGANRQTPAVVRWFHAIATHGKRPVKSGEGRARSLEPRAALDVRTQTR